MRRFIDKDILIKAIEDSKIKNKSIIKIINEQPYKILIDEEYDNKDNKDNNIYCPECVYYPDKSPCQYCEGYSNFMEIPF